MIYCVTVSLFTCCCCCCFIKKVDFKGTFCGLKSDLHTSLNKMRSHLSTLSSLSPLSHQWIIYIIYRSPATYKLVVFSDLWKSWSLIWIMIELMKVLLELIFYYIFSVRLLSVLRGHSVFFIPATTANDLRFSIPHFIHYIYCPILIHEKEPVFPFLMLSAKQGNYWYHFYNMVWCGPWLGIEPWTSRTRSQHSTNRLLRRRLNWYKC